MTGCRIISNLQLINHNFTAISYLFAYFSSSTSSHIDTAMTWLLLLCLWLFAWAKLVSHVHALEDIKHELTYNSYLLPAKRGRVCRVPVCRLKQWQMPRVCTIVSIELSSGSSKWRRVFVGGCVHWCVRHFFRADKNYTQIQTVQATVYSNVNTFNRQITCTLQPVKYVGFIDIQQKTEACVTVRSASRQTVFPGSTACESLLCQHDVWIIATAWG